MRAHATIETAVEEIAYWRREAAARLWFAIGLHKAAEQRGDEDAMAEIGVNVIHPTLAALRGADAWEWHERCEVCGGFILPGQKQVAIDDGGTAHSVCIGMSDAGSPADTPEDDAAVIAEARRLIAF